MIKIWKEPYKNAFKYKREINNKYFRGNRVKIKSTQLCKKLNLTYENIKPTLDKLKKKKLITGYVWNEPIRAGWMCTSLGSQYAYIINKRKDSF